MAAPPASTGWSISIPTGPAPDPKNVIANDPFYQGELESINAQELAALGGINTAQNIWQTQFGNQQGDILQQQGWLAGEDFGAGAAARDAALAQQRIEREAANAAERTREVLASRGALDSGQFGWETNEANWQKGMALGGVQNQLFDITAQAEKQKRNEQDRLADALRDLDVENQAQMGSFETQRKTVTTGFAGQKGAAAIDAFNRLSQSGALLPPSVGAFWDETSGMYRTADGRYFDQYGNPMNAPAPPAPTGGGGGGGGGGGEIYPGAGVTPEQMGAYPESYTEYSGPVYAQQPDGSIVEVPPGWMATPGQNLFT